MIVMAKDSSRKIQLRILIKKFLRIHDIHCLVRKMSEIDMHCRRFQCWHAIWAILREECSLTDVSTVIHALCLVVHLSRFGDTDMLIDQDFVRMCWRQYRFLAECAKAKQRNSMQVQGWEAVVVDALCEHLILPSPKTLQKASAQVNWYFSAAVALT